MLSKYCGLIGWFAVLSLWTNMGWSQESATKVDSVLELPLKALLEESVSVLDLGYSLNDRSPFWPGDDYEPFKLKTIATLEKNGERRKPWQSTPLASIMGRPRISRYIMPSMGPDDTPSKTSRSSTSCRRGISWSLSRRSRSKVVRVARRASSPS
jgi:hypothetical protein